MTTLVLLFLLLQRVSSSEAEESLPEAWVSSESGFPLMSEEDRLVGHFEHFGWPPEIQPNTTGWTTLMERRLDQVRHLEYTNDDDSKYEAWVQLMASAVSQPNFTEFGWGLTRAPNELTATLRKAIHEGVATAELEDEVDVIVGPLQPLFISRPDLEERVLQELLPIHEAWSQMELVPYIAYGFRLYQNESSLLMHLDQSNTHVISCIYHIDSSEDAEPWAILIEDYAGNTNEVILTPGDMLLYESSKCLHGRPQRFHGSWYSSIFVHYYPATQEWTEINHDDMIQYAIPPDWDLVSKDTFHPKVEMVGTAIAEPDCEHSWCVLASNKTVKWHGPAEEHYLLTVGGKRYHLYDDEKAEL